MIKFSYIFSFKEKKMKQYELLTIFRPNLDTDEIEKLEESIQNM